MVILAKSQNNPILAWTGYILAGITLSLLTAWSASLYGTFQYRTRPATCLGADADGRRWVLLLYEYPGSTFYGNAFFATDQSLKMDGIRGPLRLSVPVWSCAAEPPGPAEPDWVDVVETACGWPITAWYGSFRTGTGDLWDSIGAPRNSAKNPAMIVKPRGKAAWCLAFPTLKGDQGLVILPYHPVLPGAPVSILLYSVFAWLMHTLIRAVGGISRLHRRGLGLCRSCGYDLAGLRVCPECGSDARDERGGRIRSRPS